MSIEEIKKLFEKFNIYTLDSFSLVLDIVNDLDLNNTNAAFRSIYQNKYEKNVHKFVEINEYDYITRLKKFNISEIINSIDSLNNRELEYLNSIAENALNNIDKKNKLKYSIISYSLAKFKEECSIFKYYAKNTTSKIDDDFTEEELRKLFEKYDMYDLDAFSIIFEFASFNYNVYRLYKIYKKVYDEFLTQDYYKRSQHHSISDIKNKNQLLKEKELELLELLTNAAYNCLDGVKYIDVESEKMEVYILNKSINEELSKRNTQKKINKNKKIIELNIMFDFFLINTKICYNIN